MGTECSKSTVVVHSYLLAYYIQQGGVLNRSTKRKQDADADGVPSHVGKEPINYMERDALLYDSTASIN